ATPVASSASASAAAAATGEAAALGHIDFQVTTESAEARRHFLRGALALHSFWYDEATKEFEAAVVADPHSPMGRWGVAMSHSRLLWRNDDLEEGRAALAAIAQADLDRVSPRERAWVGAARVLFGEGTVVDRRAAFARSM